MYSKFGKKNGRNIEADSRRSEIKMALLKQKAG
jgi:hypothetical protein